MRSTPLPNPVRQPGYQPTDQVAQTQQYSNRRDRRRAAREGPVQDTQVQYITNAISDPNRNPNPNPILLRQPIQQTITPMNQSAILSSITPGNSQGERSDVSDQKHMRDNQQTMFSYYGPKPGTITPGQQQSTTSSRERR